MAPDSAAPASACTGLRKHWQTHASMHNWEHCIIAARAFPVASVGSTLGPQPSRLALVACEHATQLKSAGRGGAG